MLLESLACGKPVVATNIWGTAEVITSDDLGILVEADDPSALATALDCALQKKWDANIMLEYAKQHSWEKTAEGIYDEWQKLLIKQA